MNRSYVSIFCVLHALAGSLSCSAADLTIMAEDAAEPFSRPDGTGYANDIVKASFGAAHISVKLDVVPYARCKKNLLEGKTPACFSMSWRKEFEAIVAFSDQPIFQVYADVFQNAAKPTMITRAEDLKSGAAIGIVNEYEYPNDIYALERTGVVLQPAPNERSLLQMLALGRLDAAIVMTSDFGPPGPDILQPDVATKVRYAFRSGVMKSYIGFSLKNPQGDWARRRFNDGYAHITADGTVAEIKRKWLVRESQ